MKPNNLGDAIAGIMKSMAMTGPSPHSGVMPAFSFGSHLLKPGAHPVIKKAEEKKAGEAKKDEPKKEENKTDSKDSKDSKKDEKKDDKPAIKAPVKIN